MQHCDGVLTSSPAAGNSRQNSSQQSPVVPLNRGQAEALQKLLSAACESPGMGVWSPLLPVDTSYSMHDFATAKRGAAQQGVHDSLAGAIMLACHVVYYRADRTEPSRSEMIIMLDLAASQASQARVYSAWWEHLRSCLGALMGDHMLQELQVGSLYA
ncbi:hypothetical protein WJX73_010261 [Symbiochloris irregularis]|uniref:Uncharacterized protein n=1 Tax=Symbiochloris irregularis TaxID=706552 RepID=A0AAW1Q076_9CHLO